MILQRGRGYPGFMKEYLKLCQESFKSLQKKIPGLWRAIMNRRYLIPQYRQPDYFSQEACDYMLLDFIAEFTQKFFNRGHDEVLNTQWVALLRALEFDRPTFYLEKELAPKIAAGKLPLDLEVDMIQWTFPSIRVYLPKGFLTVKRDGQDCSLMFLDIVKVEKDVKYHLPLDFAEELLDQFGDFKALPMHNKTTGFGVTGNLDFDCPEGPIAYAATSPINQTTIARLMDINHYQKLEASLTSDQLDNDLTTNMLTIALRILMIMSSYEIVPDPESDEPEEIIRKPRMEGERLIPGLYNAKFIGQQITKLTESGARARGLVIPTGIHMSSHWVCGHPKRQVYGPERSLRKLIWVQPYHTRWHGEEKNL
jgi:hypothetical protein